MWVGEGGVSADGRFNTLNLRKEILCEADSKFLLLKLSSCL